MAIKYSLVSANQSGLNIIPRPRTSLIYQDTKLPNVSRSEAPAFIQVFQQERSAEVKQAMYAGSTERFDWETGPG